MHLKSDTSLRAGNYVIESVLGQGGFGITYLAEQTGLERKVAIKEFFMKEHCERDVDTLPCICLFAGDSFRKYFE